MKFKLVESVEVARQFVQELAYEAIDELGNKDLRDYLRWFDNQLEYYDLDKEEQETAVTDFYIEAIDCGKIKRPKTMITSQLKDYIESNSNLLDNVDALIDNCPEHLRHELQLALDVAELNESLNEELLTEKLWVKVQDNTGLSEPFYFYATDKNTLKDVNTLLPIIKNKQKGTYKQQLNQDIVKELQSNYVNSSKKYILKIVSTNIPANELEAMKNRIITITDRDLRKQAEQDVIVSTNLNPKHYLIHHKHKGEENNNLSNIMLVSRSSGDAAAHAVHKLLEFQGPTVRVGSTSVPVFEHDGTNWTQTFTVDITIR